VVNGGQVAQTVAVRERYRQLKPLATINVETRGWLMDVLLLVRSLRVREFTNTSLYAHTAHLQRLHPGNRHVKEKIRQQLQYLRDLGLITALDRGRWQLKS